MNLFVGNVQLLYYVICCMDIVAICLKNLKSKYLFVYSALFQDKVKMSGLLLGAESFAWGKKIHDGGQI